MIESNPAGRIIQVMLHNEYAVDKGLQIGPYEFATNYRLATALRQGKATGKNYRLVCDLRKLGITSANYHPPLHLVRECDQVVIIDLDGRSRRYK